MKKSSLLAGFLLALNLPAYSQTETIDIWTANDSIPDAVTLSSMGNGTFGFDYTNTSDQGKSEGVPESFTTALGNTITINLTALIVDPDPSVRFAFGVNNPDGLSGTTPYSFTFTTPVTLAPDTYTVHSSISGSLTKGEDGTNDSANVTLDPPAGGNLMQSFIGTTTDPGGKQSAGVDLIGSQVSADPSVGNSQPLNATGYSSPTINFNLTTTASQISVTTTFGLSNSDSASFSGRFDVNPVQAAPEPRSIGLGLICLVAFALLARRRSKV